MTGEEMKTEQAAKKPGGKKWGLRLVLVAAVIVAAVYFTPGFFYSLAHESTDDAQIKGTIVPVAAQVGGVATEVAFEEYDRIERGQVLVRIDPRDYDLAIQQKQAELNGARADLETIRAQMEEQRRALDEGHAQLENQQAKVVLAEKEKARFARLLQQSSASQSDFDQADTQWKVAVAESSAAEAGIAMTQAALERLEAQLNAQQFQIQQSEAELSQAELDRERTTIAAPVDGVIAKKNVEPGQYVQAGQTVFSMVNDNDVWVVANFKETQIRRIRVGQPVTIGVDAYPGAAFHGRVDSFQPGSGSVFSLLPPENATGNYVKVVQRVPVKIIFDNPPDAEHPLWPGLMVVPHVETRPEFVDHPLAALLSRKSESARSNQIGAADPAP